MSKTIFDKIVSKEIPANIIYEDEFCLAFKDVNPVAQFHVLLIPKEKGNLNRLSNASEEDKELLGHLLHAVSLICKQENLSKGFRIVINDGEFGGQTIDHLHLHIIGGQ